MIFFTRNKTSNLNRDYIEEDTFQVISSVGKKEKLLRRIYLRIGIGFRKIPAGGKKAEENRFAEHGDNDRKSIVFRDRERSATKLWAASARPAPRKKKIVENGYVARVRKGTCKERRLTNLICSRETRLERLLRNLVWKFNN